MASAFGLGLLVRQKKQFKDLTLGFEMGFFTIFEIF